MSIGTRLYTFLKGKFINSDEYGNRYYESKNADIYGRKKRWVIYNGLAEPSKIPPSWHGWLHYTTDDILAKSHSWQKKHIPNLTGTDLAYRPAGHILKGNKRKKSTGDYIPWKP